MNIDKAIKYDAKKHLIESRILIARMRCTCYEEQITCKRCLAYNHIITAIMTLDSIE